MRRLVPTWALLNEVPVRTTTRVSFGRVLRQRRAFLAVGAVALHHMGVEALLEQAVERAADGVRSEMAKIAALQPDGSLLVIAGRNLKPGVAGNARIPADQSNPAGQCITERRIVNIPDLRRCPQYELPSIYAEHHVVSTVNIPVLLDSGPFGLLEIDGVERRDFDALDLTFLVCIAGIIGEGVARMRRETALNRELGAREILMREHHHRVRNQYQVLSAALDVHARSSRTPDSRARFIALKRRVFALASLYDHLLGAADEGTVLLQEYMGSLCSSIRDFYGMQERAVSLTFECTPELRVDIDVASTLGLILNELVANSVEHAFGAQGGAIAISIEREPAGGARLVVSDNGVGYRASAGSTTGMNTVRRMLNRLGAVVELSGPPGTTWDIRVPPMALHPTWLP